MLLLLPCKACRECCKHIGHAGGGCCKVVGSDCGGDGEVMRKALCASPFTPQVLLTLALQIPPVYWGITTLLDPADDCSFLNVWMYVFALLSICHVVGAFCKYIMLVSR